MKTNMSSSFTNVLTPEEIKPIRGEQAEAFCNELAEKYNITDLEGRKLLNKLCIACTLIGARASSEAITKGLDNYLKTGKTGYEIKEEQQK